MKRKTGSAQWRGSLEEGGGTVSTETSLLDRAPYGFNARFGNGPGTNPEELLGAAHAACFSMALAKALGDENLTPESLDTRASVSLEKNENGMGITRVHLHLRAKVEGVDQARFQRIASEAKKNCTVSRLFAAEVSLEAALD